MDALVTIPWASGIKYYTKHGNSTGFVKIPKIISIGSIKTSIDIYSRSFTSSIVAIKFDDSDGEFSDRMTGDDKAMTGIDIGIKLLPPGGATYITVRALFLKERYIDVKNKTFTIIASDNYFEMGSAYLDLITRDQFPNAHYDAYGKAIQQIYGAVDNIDTGTIIAYRTNSGGATANSYLLCDSATGGTVTSLQDVYTPDNTDITGSSSLVTVGNYQYVNYTGTAEDYLKVNCTTSSDYTVNSVLSKISGVWSEFPVVVFQITDFINYMNLHKVSYVLDDLSTGKDIIQIGTMNAGAYWFIDEAQQINLTVFDVNSQPSPTVKLYEYDIMSFNYSDDDTYIKNRISGKYAFKNTDSKFRQNLTVVNDDNKSDSIDNYGIKYIDDEFKYYGSKIQTYNIMKYKQIMYDRPILIAKITVPILADTDQIKATPTYEVGKYIYMTYSEAITDTERLYMIVGMSINSDNDTIDYDLWDIEHFDDLDAKTKLLINSNNLDNSTEIYNSAAGGWLQFTNTNIFHDTAQKKWGDSSLRADGTGDLTSDTNAHSTSIADYDIGTEATFTIDDWVYYDAIGAWQGLLDFYEDVDNYWYITITNTGAIEFKLRIGAVDKITLTSTTLFSATTWYHVAVIRDGSGNWGLYINGIQEAFDSDSLLTYTVDGNLTIFEFNGGSSPMTGYSDELRLSLDNPFGGNPVAGNTDLITLPQQAYDWYNDIGIPEGSATVFCIAPNSASADYNSATEYDKDNWGYIANDTGLMDDGTAGKTIGT